MRTQLGWRNARKTISCFDSLLSFGIVNLLTMLLERSTKVAKICYLLSHYLVCPLSVPALLFNNLTFIGIHSVKLLEN